ncbi:MAG: hypothetical protein CL996_08580 [Euryarchaeota archaeon]|nr:hypothetical protein [Euryarchaeota archaeon]
MSTYEAVRYNFNGSALTNIVAIEVGTILPWSNSTLPSGYLNCDGTAVSRSTYSALFAIIGTDYGSGNGSSTFNLPDLQDKVPVGVSGSKTVASSGGAATVTPTGSITINALTPSGTITGSTGNHTLSSGQLPSHSHSQDHGRKYGSFDFSNSGYFIDNGIYYLANMVNTGSVGGNAAHSHSLSASFSGSSVTPTGSTSINAVSTLQPYVAIKFMIKT